jgi:hypothetical protein
VEWKLRIVELQSNYRCTWKSYPPLARRRPPRTWWTDDLMRGGGEAKGAPIISELGGSSALRLLAPSWSKYFVVYMCLTYDGWTWCMHDVYAWELDGWWLLVYIYIYLCLHIDVYVLVCMPECLRDACLQEWFRIEIWNSGFWKEYQ